MPLLVCAFTAVLFGRASFDISTYGAIGDGATVCTAAIQRAIDDAAKHGGGTVRVPAGRFLTGTVELRSHVRLRVEQGGELLGSANLHDYRRGVWRALVLGRDLEDVSIDGQGTIDGNADALLKDVKMRLGTGELRIPRGSWRPSEVDRPEILEFDHCRNVRVHGVTLRHSLCWVETYRDCDGLDIDGVTVDSKTYWNNDGVDVVDCKNVAIVGCNIDADDDGICLKSERAGDRCDNVRIENCRIRSSASAIKFGTASYGGFRHVRIRGIRIHDTFRSAVALESVDGGTLQDVVASDVFAVNTGNAFFIRLGHRNPHAPPGRIEGVVLEHFEVQVPSGAPDAGYPFQGPEYKEPHNVYPASIVGIPGAPVVNVTLRDMRITMPGGADPAVASAPLDDLAAIPERAASYPEFSMFGELPAWALYMRHVRGLTFDGFAVKLAASDYRPAFVADDVAGVRGTVTVSGADKLPQFIVLHGRAVAVSGNAHQLSIGR